MTRLALALLLCATACATPDTELSGRMDAGMVSKVQIGLDHGHRDFTINRTGGGMLFNAYVIAGLLNKHGASLTADGRCDSACALLLQGVHRHDATAEAVVRTHEPFMRYEAGPANNPRTVEVRP